MNKRSRLIILMLCLVLLNVAIAFPPIATEFYGTAVLSGGPAPPMTKVQAYVLVAGNETLCGDFDIVNAGKYGLLGCLGDDPDTTLVEGAVENQKIIFKMVVSNASKINNTNNLTFYPLTINATASGIDTWNSGEFHRVNLFADFHMWWLEAENQTNVTQNETNNNEFCGDGICGSTEDCKACSLDCGPCPPTKGGGTGGGSGEKEESSGQPPQPKTPKGSPPPTLACIETWECSEFGACKPEGKKYRVCEDKAKCGTENRKPKTEEDCCYEDWSCSQWSECSEFGEQTRTCYDGNLCNTTQFSPNTTQPCHYPTCNDGMKNGKEEGIDCGGPCPVCKGPVYSKPIVEQPAFVSVCGDGICSIDEPCNCQKDCRKFPWFIIIIALVIVTLEHIITKKRAEKIRNNIYAKKFERLKKISVMKRKSFWFKTIVMLASLIFSFYLYFFATCPGSFKKYLAYLIVAGTITPIVTYFLMKRFEYSEEEKEIRYELLIETHREQLEKFIDFENKEIRDVELKITRLLKETTVQMDENLRKDLNSVAYKLEILAKYLKEDKDYIDVESGLCEQLENIRQLETYKKAAEDKRFKQIDGYLQILLTHHKEKNELLKKLQQDEAKISAEENKINIKGQIEEASAQLNNSVQNTQNNTQNKTANQQTAQNSKPEQKDELPSLK